ncbi:hypothetical protein MSC49_03890 [Methylosinus sp. C49]|uniref:ABC transporter substrate-binding protein n=1 Tax=Methylosinus sp. C49 TaxID=2699395 RepID=UPI0013676668|nr:ABC transporter substrate-binding protein [Methylosinus sp. C49]BBU60454.1 hypothetical protein MSC49_03890 [Methylosinus sp. C49]
MRHRRSRGGDGRLQSAGFAVACGLALVIGLLAPKVRPKATSASTSPYVDMLGRAHDFSAPPRRLVFTANILPAFLSLTHSLDRVVGASELGLSSIRAGLLDRIFPQARGLARVGGFDIPNFEETLKLSPDAALGWAVQFRIFEKAPAFEFVAFQNSFPLMRSEIALWRKMAELCGASAIVGPTLARYDADMAAIAASLRGDEKPVSVLAVVANSAKSWVGGSKYYLNERLDLVRGVNVARVGAATATFSLEQLALFDPDVVLLQAFPVPLEPRAFLDDPAWRLLRAVRAGKVYRMPDFPSFLAPVFDPLLVRWLAELLHPGVDAGDMRAAVRRAYHDAFSYDLDDEAIDELLAVEANRRSFGYGRFSSERRASAK